MNHIADQMGYLILDLLYMGLQNHSTENDIFKDWLELRLEANRAAPARKAE